MLIVCCTRADNIGIAIIPESLIAVLTITMVVGMTQMRKRKVVIRQLSALYVFLQVLCADSRLLDHVRVKRGLTLWTYLD